MAIPNVFDYRCPITLKIPTRPVHADDDPDHIFQQEALEEWRMTNSNCPLCRRTITGRIDVDTDLQEKIDRLVAEKLGDPTISDDDREELLEYQANRTGRAEDMRELVQLFPIRNRLKDKLIQHEKALAQARPQRGGCSGTTKVALVGLAAILTSGLYYWNLGEFPSLKSYLVYGLAAYVSLKNGNNNPPPPRTDSLYQSDRQIESLVSRKLRFMTDFSSNPKEAMERHLTYEPDVLRQFIFRTELNH